MKKYKFNAKIQEGERGGAFVFFPYDVEKEFGTKGRVPVKVTFNGVPDTTGLIKYGHPQHILGIHKAMREQIGKDPGDVVEIELWKDEEERKLEVPVALQKLLKKEGLLPAFEKLSYTYRKEYCRWINEAKKGETRERRLAKAVEMLRRGIKTPE